MTTSPLPTKRNLIRSLRVPQYAAVGLDPSTDEVAVSLDIGGRVIDVRRNSVVVALRPLTFGVMFDASAPSREIAESRGRMYFSDRSSDRTLGFVDLTFDRAIHLGAHALRLFNAGRSCNYCLPFLIRPAQDIYERWRTARHQRANPFNFRMTHRDLKALFVFYIRPRPVCLVSVEHDGKANMFPMDLIGHTASPWFSFALRLSSPSVDLIKRARRLAAAGLDVRYKATAYELAQQHNKPFLDVDALPFETVRSPEFGLRVPSESLFVREVYVEHAHDIGSHSVFLTRVIRESVVGEHRGSLQLFHTHGAYADLLIRQGRPLVPA